MLPSRFDSLPDGMFPRLRALLDPLPVPDDVSPLMCQIGEPQHQPPQMVLDAVTDNADLFAKYPPIGGLPALQQAIGVWLKRRFDLPNGFDADSQILPLNGTREGLYMLPQILLDTSSAEKPLIMSPNPFYQTYSAAALNAGADVYYLSARKDSGFLPDLDEPTAADWARCQMFILCSPSNPEGAVADEDYYRRLFALKAQYGFTLVVDECYSELYLDEDHPPVGALTMAARFQGDYDGVLVLHSLSKRSNLPGLRSGFIAGDAAIMKDFLRLRNYGGPQVPLPVQHASIKAWSDEDHVIENRRLYREKFQLAAEMQFSRFDWQIPAGGMFLWLTVGDGERAAKALWQEAHLRSMPGAYMARPDKSGKNPGDAMLRIAMTQDFDTTRDALQRVIKVLG